MVSKQSGDIKNTVLDIKQRLRLGEDPIKVLNNAFYGKTALIVSAGPSCKRWKEVYDRLLKENGEVLVVTVKQSLDLVGDVAHFHFLNSGNLKKYNYKPDCISVFTRNSSHDVVFGTYDIEFKVMEELDREMFYLARTNFYDAYELNKTGKYRPPGPGGMHESVFHTLVHMGVNHIETIGWDIANDSGQNVHFDDKHASNYQSSIFKSKLKDGINRLGIIRLAKEVNKFFKYVTNYVEFKFDKKINISGMFQGEAELVASSFPKLKDWLNFHDISININTDMKWLL